jgi:hypothetical protein
LLFSNVCFVLSDLVLKWSKKGGFIDRKNELEIFLSQKEDLLTNSDEGLKKWHLLL